MAKKGETIAGTVILLAGAGVALESLRYHIGTARQPLPGLFPFLAGLLLVFLSGILIIRAGRSAADGKESLGNLRRPGKLVLGLALYILLSSLVGYMIAATILSIMILRSP